MFESHIKTQEHMNVTKASTIVLDQAAFPGGFAKFMDALIRNGIVAENYTRTEGAIGYRWDDSRARGGVMVETATHPMTNTPGTVIFEGMAHALDLVKCELIAHGVLYASMKTVTRK